MTDEGSGRARFIRDRGFELDRFQLEAFDGVDEGRHVVVAAPTGSGKTVVAEYLIERGLAAGQRVFYTTPIKALSNQKFHDLVTAHGSDQVGLLTGDQCCVEDDAVVVIAAVDVVSIGRSGRLTIRLSIDSGSKEHT